MTMTNALVDRAETIVPKLEELLYHIRCAIDEVRSVDTSACKDIIESLKSASELAESEKSEYERILSDAESRDEYAMSREFERMVV